MTIQIPEKFEGFLNSYRYKTAYGGRGSAKSWTVARLLVHTAVRQPEFVVCAREFQNSIDDSVYRLLEQTIKRDNLPDYKFTKTCIENTRTGSEFVFKGLSKLDGASIKSLEGATKLWVEEGQNVSAASWDNVIPTIRADDSEIWTTFNPDIEDAPTYQRLVLNPPPNSYVIKVNWSDNPWFPAVLEQERLHMLATDPVGYQNVWEGEPRSFSDGSIFKEEMASLERAGRIGDVPYDPAKGVYTWWDMSHSASVTGDPHAIAFVQVADGNTIHVIDYWEGNNVALPLVAKDVILGRDYNYLGHFLPHDASRTNPHTGKTDAEILTEIGLKNVQLVERTPSLEKNVNQLRLLLPRLRIDKTACKTLLGALKGYRMERNEKTGIWAYRHDWTSHGVSTLRGLANYNEQMKPSGGLSGFKRGYNPMV